VNGIPSADNDDDANEAFYSQSAGAFTTTLSVSSQTAAACRSVSSLCSESVFGVDPDSRQHLRSTPQCRTDLVPSKELVGTGSAKSGNKAKSRRSSLISRCLPNLESITEADIESNESPLAVVNANVLTDGWKKNKGGQKHGTRWLPEMDRRNKGPYVKSSDAPNSTAVALAGSLGARSNVRRNLMPVFNAADDRCNIVSSNEAQPLFASNLSRGSSARPAQQQSEDNGCDSLTRITNLAESFSDFDTPMNENASESADTSTWHSIDRNTTTLSSYSPMIPSNRTIFTSNDTPRSHPDRNREDEISLSRRGMRYYNLDRCVIVDVDAERGCFPLQIMSPQNGMMSLSIYGISIGTKYSNPLSMY